MFGGSYSVKIGKEMNGFLHKIHAVEPVNPKKKKEKDAEEEDTQKQQRIELEVN